MKRKTTMLALSAVLWTAAAFGAPPKNLPPAGYDETRDPAADLRAAVAKATKENKRILIEVGGEWCGYCRLLNKTMHDDARITRRLDDSFILLKVNFSPDMTNEAFLSQYPAIRSYPHLFVLDSDGTLLLSHNPDSLMNGDKYAPDKILAFLEKWAPKARS
jgi:thioredoxin-related protein